MNEKGAAGELNNPEYQDEAYRNVRAREGTEIQEALARLVASVPVEEAMHRAQSFGLAWGVVRAPEENYTDPHWNDRGFFLPVDHEELASPVFYRDDYSTVNTRPCVPVTVHRSSASTRRRCCRSWRRERLPQDPPSGVRWPPRRLHGAVRWQACVSLISRTCAWARWPHAR